MFVLLVLMHRGGRLDSLLLCALDQSRRARARRSNTRDDDTRHGHRRIAVTTRGVVVRRV